VTVEPIGQRFELGDTPRDCSKLLDQTSRGAEGSLLDTGTELTQIETVPDTPPGVNKIVSCPVELIQSVCKRMINNMYVM
jgi:hypothetical protein